jgi:pimeloyl-ACP methyl ester carboxylesterase
MPPFARRNPHMAPRSALLLVLLLVAPAALAQSTETLRYTIAKPDPVNGYSYYSVEVIHTYNPQKRRGAGVFFVPSAGHTARFFDPLAAAVVTAPNTIKDAYAIDLPGHGSSGWPDGLLFGDISIGDYALAVYQVLNQMRSVENRNVRTICGHGYGALLVEYVESQLSKGVPMLPPWSPHPSSSLEQDFGVENMILMASSMPKELPWPDIDAPFGAGKAKDFIVKYAVDEPPLGKVIDVDDAAFTSALFAVNGVPVSGAPSGAEIAAIKSIESFRTTGEYLGIDFQKGSFVAIPRVPSVQPNLWAGLNLTVVAFEFDPFALPSEEQALATYLKPGLSIIEIMDSESVHDMPYSKPGSLLSLF